MRISAVLTPHQLNLVRKILVRNRIVKDQKPFWGLDLLFLNILPGQLGAEFVSHQIAVEGIMTKLFSVSAKFVNV